MEKHPRDDLLGAPKEPSVRIPNGPRRDVHNPTPTHPHASVRSRPPGVPHLVTWSTAPHTYYDYGSFNLLGLQTERDT